MPDPDATSRLEHGPREGTVEEPLAPLRQPYRLVPYLEAAALTFLGLLTLGASLLVAVKLQYPRLGAGADPVEILTSIVILSLALLRAEIHVGALEFAVLPLGTLIAVAFIVRWACRSTIASTSFLRALWVGPLFGVIAILAALAFRHRFDTDPVYAGSVSSGFFGVVWVALFVAWFVATRHHGTVGAIRRALADLQRTRRSAWEAVAVTGLMLGGTTVLATAGGLVWVIIALVRGGGPQALELTGIVAAAIYLAAFAPNLVIAAISLSVGASLQVGAGLTVRGRVRDRVQELSVASDGLDATVLLIAVPLIACGLAGVWLARNSERASRPLPILGWSSVAFAATLTLLAWLGHARLGAQLAADRGFGVVAADAASVFVMASMWGFIGSLVGWTVARVRE